MKAMRKFYVFGSAFFTFVIIVLILIYFDNVDLLILQINFGFESGKFRGQYLEKGKVQILHTSNQNVQDTVTKKGNSDFCNDYGEKVLVNSQRSFFRWKDCVTDHAKRTSVQYSSAKIYLKSPGQVSVLKIVTRDRNGNRKEVGGDFWRVYILNETFSNFVYMQDNLDGVYEGMFVFPAAGIYRMVCILEYSLWDAFRDPPSNWFRKGIAFIFPVSESFGVNVSKARKICTDKTSKFIIFCSPSPIFFCFNGSFIIITLLFLKIILLPRE